MSPLYFGPWINFIGPLPEAAGGNKHLLVVTDHFTKWCEVFPAKDQKAHTVAQILVSTIFSRFCPPSVLHHTKVGILRGTQWWRCVSLWVSTNLGLPPIILNAMA